MTQTERLARRMIGFMEAASNEMNAGRHEYAYNAIHNAMAVLREVIQASEEISRAVRV